MWLGSTALELRLADRIGGLYEAIGVAKELIGVPAEKPVTVQRWPNLMQVIQSAAKKPKNSEDVSYSGMTFLAIFFLFFAEVGKGRLVAYLTLCACWHSLVLCCPSSCSPLRFVLALCSFSISSLTRSRGHP